jgi:hypothetical protein
MNAIKTALVTIFAQRYTQVLLVLLNVMGIAWACLTAYPARLFFKPR